MKKLIAIAIFALASTAIAIFALASTANSAEYTKFCGTLSGAAVVVAKISKYQTHEEAVTKTYIDKLDKDEVTDIVNTVLTKAYYSWSGFKDAGVKRLAFMSCELEFLKLGYK